MPSPSENDAAETLSSENSSEAEATQDNTASDAAQDPATSTDTTSGLANGESYTGPAPGAGQRAQVSLQNMQKVGEQGEGKVDQALNAANAASGKVEAADAEKAQADAAKEAEIAPYKEKEAKAYEDYQSVIQERQKFQTQLDQQLATMETMSGQLAATTIRDPWADASTPVKIGGMLALALGGFSQGLNGGPNVVAEQLNQAISRDISLQRMRIEQGQKGLENKKMLVGQFLQNTEHLEHAQDLAHLTALTAVQKRIALMKETTTDPQRKAALDQMKAAVEYKQALLNQSVTVAQVGRQNKLANDEASRQAAYETAQRTTHSIRQSQVNGTAKQESDLIDKAARARNATDIVEDRKRSDKLGIAVAAAEKIAHGDLNNLTNEQVTTLATQIAAGEIGGRPASQLIDKIAPGATAEAKVQALKTYLMNDPQARKAGGFVAKLLEQARATKDAADETVKTKTHRAMKPYADRVSKQGQKYLEYESDQEPETKGTKTVTLYKDGIPHSIPADKVDDAIKNWKYTRDKQ